MPFLFLVTLTLDLQTCPSERPNMTSNFLYTCPWLGPHLTTMQYVMYFIFVADVQFNDNWPGEGDASRAYILRVIHQVSAPRVMSGVSTVCDVM